MVLESACLPIPSEIIMPFSGFLVSHGKFSFWLVILFGTTGNLLGSIVAYYVGFYGGRPWLEKYGKYILISSYDLEITDKWFEKYGQGAIFFGRLLPVVRTFISLPAGIAKMSLLKFCFYTFLGSLSWAYILTFAGVFLGERWITLRLVFEKFEILIGGIILITIIWWLKRHLSLSS